LRKIASAIATGDYRDTVSHEKVSAMLNGEGLPRWSKLEAVVRQLAAWHVPGRDPDSEAARFLAMWEAAYPADAHTSSITENGSQGVPASSLTNTQNNEPGDQIEPHVTESLREMSSNQIAFDHDLFLLHASLEIDVAQRIRMELESAGYRVWWDDGQLINSGAVGELTNTIRACRYLVVLLSTAFAKSPYSHEYLTREVVSAIENAGVSIVPALYEMSPIPPELEPREFADFRTSPNTGLGQLLTILRSIEGKVPKRFLGPTLHDAVSKLIAMVADAPELYVAVDLGGTKAYISVMTREAERLFDRKFTTKNHGDASALLGFLLTSIEEAIDGLHKMTGIDLREIKEQKITAYGIAFAGPTDAVPGVVRDASNFHIKDFPLADRLGGHLGKPVFVENDANLGVLGEAWKGVARRHRSVVGIVVGTGIGGGIVVNRQLWRGSNSAAGEIGHILIDPNSSVKCGCGQKGCFEALASRKAIAEELSRRKRRSDPDDVRW
jgi:predicted NBD/HSP70 family sugar kinase